MASQTYEHEDREILRLRAEKLSFARIGEKLHRSPDYVAKRYHVLTPGSKGRGVHDYTPEEDAIILANAAKPTGSFIHLLPGRSAQGVAERARKLGIDRTHLSGVSANPGGNRPYTPEDDAVILSTLDRPIVEVMELLGRTRKSIDTRRHKLRRQFAPPKTVVEPVEPKERPFGVPFTTASGIRAIRLGSGVVPYVACLYQHLHE